MKAFLKFLWEEDAATAVEYAVMLAMILVVCISAISYFGSQTNSTYTNISSEIDTYFNGS